MKTGKNQRLHKETKKIKTVTIKVCWNEKSRKHLISEISEKIWGWGDNIPNYYN